MLVDAPLHGVNVGDSGEIEPFAPDEWADCLQKANTECDIAGHRAGSEAYHIAAIRMMAEGKLMQVTVWGRYLDTWSRRDGKWGIDHRLVLRDLDEIREVAPLTPEVPLRSRDCPSYAVLRPAASRDAKA